MSENSTAASDLTSQYTAQVAGDLERNVKEQERVTAEIASLQEKLTVLQHDHTILVNMRQALGLVAAPAAPAAPAGTSGAPAPQEAPEAGTTPGGATVPAPRGRIDAEPATEKPKRAAEKPKRAKRAAARTAPAKEARKPSAAKAGPSAARGTTTRSARNGSSEDRSPKAGTTGKDGPKLVELVRLHLSERSEPRSAAEVADALGKAHPERTIRTTVVRSTLEGLVARNQAQRTKQGSSVFYTTPDTTPGSTPGTTGRTAKGAGGPS
ncbi:hypothetical protein ACIF9R_28550 [Streptomyces sp. NPDC086080]|uniref:hypothetical protein n=1 Tax=Streptomyces sp. NPDC086080 TaxID=3365748 RepID=UPI0037CD820D